MAEVSIFLFAEMGCLIKQVFFFLLCFTAGFVVLYLFVSKGSVVSLVVNQIHWL